MPPEQEQDVADWYRENEFLYNFRTVDYKNKEKMQRVTQEKAETLGITAEQLITWLKSMRDRAGKITKKQPFGSGAIAFYYFVETPYLHIFRLHIVQFQLLSTNHSKKVALKCVLYYNRRGSVRLPKPQISATFRSTRAVDV